MQDINQIFFNIFNLIDSDFENNENSLIEKIKEILDQYPIDINHLYNVSTFQKSLIIGWYLSNSNNTSLCYEKTKRVIMRILNQRGS